MAAAVTTHLQRTEGLKRQAAVVAARIVSVTNETPTVRRFLLRPELQQSAGLLATHDSPAADTGFDFHPGQWLDCFLPGVDVVGGYSICSDRRQLEKDGVIELAVKYSSHPPAMWMHTRAQPGDEIQIRVGGEFVMDDATMRHKRILFIAGGVGINPLISMMRELHDTEEFTLPGRRAMLLYSAKERAELAFRKEIDELTRVDPKLSAKYFVTKEDVGGEAGLESGRIGASQLRSAINELAGLDGATNAESSATTTPSSSSSDTLPTSLTSIEAFVCGPKAMIDECVANLTAIGLPQPHIHYESWW